jgi:peptidoglycan/LPS O-acetylase OafA/YrhL
MSPAVVVVTLFAGLGVTAVVWIAILRRARGDQARTARARFVFLFCGCLLLVCLGLLASVGRVGQGVLLANLAALAANLLGLLLTWAWSWPSAPRRPAAVQAPRASRGTRAYQIYLNGEPFGVITRQTFDQLNALGLVKRQPTLELVDDYQKRAAQAGFQVQRFANRERTQMLVRVVAAETHLPLS